MKRSKHSLSHYKLLTCNQGDLVPIGLMEVLPGDTIQQATSLLIRTNPLLAPVMHPVHARVHHWFVPHRLVWEDWEDFITGGPDGDDASVFPTLQMTAAGIGTLPDYLGIPSNSGNLTISALPFRAYTMIWNEWYRDQDLQTEAAISYASGADATSYNLKKAAWEKDYFTTARPWPQKGSDVTLPIAGSADVKTAAAQGSSIGIYSTAASQYRLMDADLSTVVVDASQTGASAAKMYADLSTATSVTVNQLREAFALQRYQEARARYGSRYTEYLRYLGVRSSDARLQRPEYLGGGKQTIQFSEVLQTAPTTDGDDTEGVGNLKGHGIGALRSNRYRRFFEEHGYVISVLSVRPRTMYVNGVNRTWLRRTKEDFFQKELQHIGQQEVMLNEVYAQEGDSSTVFGYQDRYDEYRRMESTIAGEFRTTLDFWHMARDFSSAPTLNASFIAADPTDRVYASTSTHQLYIMASHSVQARRMVAATGSSFGF